MVNNVERLQVIYTTQTNHLLLKRRLLLYQMLISTRWHITQHLRSNGVQNQTNRILLTNYQVHQAMTTPTYKSNLFLFFILTCCHGIISSETCQTYLLRFCNSLLKDLVATTTTSNISATKDKTSVGWKP